MPLKITDRLNAARHFDWADCIISIDDPDSALGRVGPKHGLFLFQDVLLEGPGAPTLAICAEILDHAAACGVTKASRLLVHCQAGISRSPAVALGIEASLGLEPALAWSRVHRARSCAWPNLLVVSHFDQLLGLNGELAALATAIDRRRCRYARPDSW